MTPKSRSTKLKNDAPGRVAGDAITCAEFYDHHAGMTTHPAIVPDVYGTIARLARIVEQQQQRIESLEQSRTAQFAGYPGYD